MKNGSTEGMTRPGPKFPLPSLGWTTFIEFMMQSLKFGTFREQMGIVGAIKNRKEYKLRGNISQRFEKL